MSILRLKQEAELERSLRSDSPAVTPDADGRRHWDHNRTATLVPAPAGSAPMPYQLLADVVLTLHVGLVVFIVGGFGAIVAGNRLGWRWVNRLWLRVAHLAAIVIVAGEAWFGAVCPITTLEMRLRSQARAPTYGGSFVEHWLQRLLYHEAPPWVFVAAYTLFALAVLAAWWAWPPRRHERTGAR